MSPSGEEICFIFDWVHLFKLLRNHELDDNIFFPCGFFNNEKQGILVNPRKEFEELQKVSTIIKDKHLNCVSTDRQKVNIAIQLISIEVCAEFRKHFPNDTAKMALAGLNELAATCWKIMTSKDTFNDDPMRCALSVHIQKQKKPLLEFVECMKSLQFINKKGHSAPKIFQKGMIITITGNY